MRNFSRDFREMIVSIFNMEYLEDEDDGSQPDENLAASQDYPEHSQSRDSNTMKICSCCKFKTRDNVEYKDHMSLHAKCVQCGMYFGDETTLSLHHKAFHALKPCEKCGKDILEANMKKHLNGHMIQRDFKVVVSKGKVKARGKEKDELEPKVAKVTGYRLFIKCKRPEVRNEHPDATPQEMIRFLNEAWNKEKAAGEKSDWDNKAKNGFDEDTRANEISEVGQVEIAQRKKNHEIQKCTICGLMIANLNVHMRLHSGEETLVIDQEVNTEQVAGTVEENPEIDLEVDGEPEVAIETAAIEENPEIGADEEGFQPGTIVMVKRKTIHWPGKVVSRNGSMVEVMIYDKARTKDTKHSKFLMPFTVDIAVCEGRGSVWVKAWKEAKVEFEAELAKKK